MATTLRRWQNEALTLWLSTRRGVASVVTGAGKTRFALACVAEAQRREPGLHVLVIVPTIALLDQWLSVMEAERLGDADVVAVHRGGVMSGLDAVFNVATVNTARKATRILTSNGRWMVVADECHRYASPSNRTAIDADWAASLGLSATPSREYDTWFEEYVEPSIGPVFYEYGYSDAAKDGILVPFQLKNYGVPLSRSEQERYGALTRRIAALTAGQDPTSEPLKRALLSRSRLAQEARARIPAAIAIMADHRGERTLLFHEKVDAAEEVARRLIEDGHRVAVYHSQMNAANRLKSLLVFRTGQVDVLVSCRALDEGLDVPDATFGLICASTASTRQRIQRMGRLLRPSPGKGTAEVATIFATEAERERLAVEEQDLEELTDVTWVQVRFG